MGALVICVLVMLFASRRNRKKGVGKWAGPRQMSPKDRKKYSLLRPYSIEEQLAERSRSPREVIPIPPGTILLDTNVVLDSVGYNGRHNEKMLEFVRNHRDRIRLCSTVKREVDGLMYGAGTSEMYARLKSYDGLVIDDPDYAQELQEMEQVHRDVSKNYTVALTWIYEKRSSVSHITGMGAVSGLVDSQIKEALQILFEKAGSDRVIVAKAMALAKKEGMTLVTSDEDIMIFAPWISQASPGLTLAYPGNIC